jgi:hypothetical protein
VIPIALNVSIGTFVMSAMKDIFCWIVFVIHSVLKDIMLTLVIIMNASHAKVCASHVHKMLLNA